MSDFTNYIETEIRDWMSQGTDIDAPPTTVYVALHAGAPGDDAASNEVSAGDYSRKGVSAGSGWNAPTADSFENANSISFTATSNNWGTITHATLWDASTGGNSIGICPLSSSVSIDGTGSDDTLEFQAGDLSFSID